MVHANEVELRDDTLLFRLLGEGRQRKEAVTKLFQDNIEPYVTLLNNFGIRFKKMSNTNTLQNIDPTELKNLANLSDTRQEVFMELGKEQGLEKSCVTLIQLAKTLARQRFPRVRETTLQPIEELSMEELNQFMSNVLLFESSKEMREFLRQLQG